MESDARGGHECGGEGEASSRHRPSCAGPDGDAAGGHPRGARRTRGWGSGVVGTLLLQLLFLATASAQFRGGTINWEPIAEGSNTVRFTVRSAWVRSAGTYVRLQNNYPTPVTGYQPKVGDMVKVQGIETPKFLVSTGFEEYLELKVTKNSELCDGVPGCNLPHDPAHWTWDSTNWFEGVSTYEVTLPSRDVTYVAELQGCCRMAAMAISENNCIRPRDGKGVVQLCNSPYLLRATVQLSHAPPPVSFIPHFVPHAWDEDTGTGNSTVKGLILPIVAAVSFYRAASKVVETSPIVSWPDVILDNRADATGSLAATALGIGASGEFLKPVPVSAVGGGGGGGAARQLLMASGIMQEETVMDLNALPVFTAPPRVMVSAAKTGRMVRMLKNAKHHIKLFAGVTCGGEPVDEVMPGADICEGGAAPSGAPAFGSVLVPAGLTVTISDACEFSGVAPHDAANLLEWGVVRKTLDNVVGAAAVCYPLTAAEAAAARTFRAVQAAAQCTVPQGSQCTTDYATIQPIWQSLRVFYSTASDGFEQAVLSMDAGAFLANGNYPVVLQVASPGSSTTTIEFVLNIMTTPSNHLKLQTPMNDFGGSRLEIPTGFGGQLQWALTGFGPNGELIFNNVDETTFGPAAAQPLSMYADPRDPGNEKWDVEWTPCTRSAGMYYYCLNVVAKQSPGHEWAPMSCVRMRVVEDLAPRIRFYAAADAAKRDMTHYQLFMGQRLEVVADAFDNARDEISFLGVTQIDTNTGDSIRARLQYEYQLVKGEKRSMPRLVEPGIPPWLSLAIAAPSSSPGAGKSRAARMVSYVANRAHSGLEFKVCFMAGDSISACKDLQSASERCITVKVRRCKYSMSAGEDFVHVAGLFEVNWLQLFSLNPLYSTPESATTAASTVISIGHSYTVQHGDTLSDILRSMGSTTDHVRLLNADLARQRLPEATAALPVGMEICIVPNSCAANM